MPPRDTSLVERLRMENIFGGNPPLAMPDLRGYGGPPPEQRTAEVEQIPQQQIAPRQRQPTLGEQTLQRMRDRAKMDVVWKPSQLDLVGGRIINPPVEQQEIQLKRELGQQRTVGQEADRAIRQQRADVYEFKARNPNMQILTPKGGNIIAVNPQTGERIDLGVATGTMSESDLQAMRGTQAMEQIGARTAGQKEVQELRGEQQRGIQEMRGEQQMGVQQLRGEQAAQRTTGRATGRVEQPTQTRVRQTLAARQLISGSPELSKFVQFNRDGTVSITGNPDLVTLSKLRRGIYGQPQDIELPAEKKTPEKAPEKKIEAKPAAPKSKYKVTVR
jgi:hypothetical protein